MNSPTRSTVLIFLALLLATCTGENPRPEPPPTRLVLLFSVDTLRGDHLGCNGYSRPTTPFIDEFAAQSVNFKNAVSQGAVTATGHMSIFTSLMPVVHQVANPHQFQETIVPLPDTIPTWGQIMKDQGWICHGLHGGGPVSAEFGFARGFDTYRQDFFYAFHADYFQPETTLARIRDLIRTARDGDSPLFLFLHHYLCHDPYIKAPPEFNQRFLDDPIPGLPLTGADLKRNNAGGPDEESFWEDFNLEDPDHLRHLIALYDGSILYSDHIFREVIEIIREEGLFDRALIILTSDHGEEFCEHGGRRHWKLFRENLHVPLVIKFPGSEHAGREIDGAVRTIDIMPTVLEYLNLPSPSRIQGISLLPLLSNRGEYDPPIISQALDFPSPDVIPPTESVRFIEDDHAYSNQLSGGMPEDTLTRGQPEWLFDIRKDPREQNNLIEARPERAAEMRARAAGILDSDRALRAELRGEPGAAATPGEELRRQLKSLGYLQ